MSYDNWFEEEEEEFDPFSTAMSRDTRMMSIDPADDPTYDIEGGMSTVEDPNLALDDLFNPSAMTPASEVVDIPSNFDVEGSTTVNDSAIDIPNRATDLNFNDRLKREYDEIDSKLTAAKKTALQPAKYTGGQAFAKIFSSVLPLILGAAIKGKKGAGAGAAAALAAQPGMIDAENAEQARADKLSLDNINDLQAQRGLIVSKLSEAEQRNMNHEDKMIYLREQIKGWKDAKGNKGNPAYADNRPLSESEKASVAANPVIAKYNPQTKGDLNTVIAMTKESGGKPSGTFEIPVAERDEQRGARGTIKQMSFLAKDLDNIASWGELQGLKTFQGLDPNRISVKMNDLVSRILLSRSGKAATDAERKILNAMISGDKTVSPRQVAQTLREFAQREADFYKDSIDYDEEYSHRDPELLKRGFDIAATGKVKIIDVASGAVMEADVDSPVVKSARKNPKFKVE